jgi:transposase
MNSMPENLPDDPELLKQMLAKMQSRVGVLEEQVALLRQRLFARTIRADDRSSHSANGLFNEAENEADPAGEASEEDVVAPPSVAASASHCRPTCRASKSSTSFPNTN